MPEGLRAGDNNPSDPMLDDMLKAGVVQRCSPLYESLVGIERKEKAAEVAELLFSFAPAAATFVSLMEAASRAGSVETVKGLCERGVASLPKNAEKQSLHRALARLSSAK